MAALIKRLIALRWPLPLIGVAGLAMAVFVLWFFQPQALFISNRAAEQLPTPGAIPAAAQTAAAAPAGPMVLASGEFRSLEHASSGRAAILKLTDGTRYLRFENLSTSNGPDLRVYLSKVPASGDWFAYGHDYIDLGALRANQGDQNYEVPAGIDLTGYRSAVIWCRRFTVGFAVAPLAPA
jgi:hypothetical protein